MTKEGAAGPPPPCDSAPSAHFSATSPSARLRGRAREARLQRIDRGLRHPTAVIPGPPYREKGSPPWAERTTPIGVNFNQSYAEPTETWWKRLF
jgi:hypothetical protein